MFGKALDGAILARSVTPLEDGTDLEIFFNNVALKFYQLHLKQIELPFVLSFLHPFS